MKTASGLTLTLQSLIPVQNLLYAPDLPILEPHLDAVRVSSRRGQDVFYKADRPLAGPLVLFPHDRHTQPWMYGFPIPTIHRFLFSPPLLVNVVVIVPSRGGR
jgi:hypothetical protein